MSPAANSRPGKDRKSSAKHNPMLTLLMSSPEVLPPTWWQDRTDHADLTLQGSNSNICKPSLGVKYQIDRVDTGKLG